MSTHPHQFQSAILHNALFLTDTVTDDCPYLNGRISVTRFFLPLSDNPAVYEILLAEGFRRSGQVFYNTECPECNQCWSIRLHAASFRPNQSQRRNCRQNADIRVEINPSEVTEEKIRLYTRYIEQIHPREGREFNPVTELESIHNGYSGSVELNYFLNDILIGVGLTDITPDAVSANYFYHDPDIRPRGIGVMNVMETLRFCLQQNKTWCYLGYYIPECRKMNYKIQYHPHEILRHSGQWLPEGI